MKLSDIGEFGFIDRIAPLGLIRPNRVVRGIGDDCAVIKLDDATCLLVTTDLLIERVHFLRSWAPANMLGRKSLAVNISDIAACGGSPRDAFVSIGVPDKVDLDWLDGFYEGLASMAREYNINLLGGDTTRSRSDLVINIALTGIVGSEEALFRNTARPGNIIVTTGPTGMSAAGCELLLKEIHLTEPWVEILKAAHINPRPHITEGRFLATSHACSAAIDVSDGLSSDLWHICRQSGVGALLFEEKIPIHDALQEAGLQMGRDPIQWALHGGEDYVLLVCIDQRALASLQAAAHDKGIELSPIGVVEKETGMKIAKRSGEQAVLEPGGWNHFRHTTVRAYSSRMFCRGDRRVGMI